MKQHLKQMLRCNQAYSCRTRV